MRKIILAAPLLVWAGTVHAQTTLVSPQQTPGPQNAFDVMGFVNVRNYGAKPDTLIQRNCSGTLTANDFKLNSCVSPATTSFFTAGMVGKIIKLMGANGLQVSTITSVDSSSEVHIADTPGWALSAASVWVYVGTDYHTQIQSASDAAAAMGATLYFPPSSDGGCYGIAAPITLNLLGPSRWLGGLSETNASNQPGCSLANLGTATQMLVGTVGTGIGQTSAMIYRPLGGVAPTYTTSIRNMTIDGTGDASPLRMDQINRCDIKENIFKGAPAASSIVNMGDGTSTGNAEGCVISDNNFISENGSSGQPIPSNPWFHAAAANNPLIGLNDQINSSDGKIMNNYFYGLSGTGSAGVYIGGGGWWVSNNHEANGTGFHTDYGYNIEGVDTKVHGNSCDTAGLACIYIGAANASVVGNNVQGTDTDGIEIKTGICGIAVVGNTFATAIAGASAIVQDGSACATSTVATNGLATYTH